MSLKYDEAARWTKAIILPHWQPLASHVATRLFAPKARYQTVSNITGVPWWFIAVVHQRESSQSWAASLAQGDPWNHVSIHVPKGRGPFGSWEDAAVDALKHCAPYAAQWKDWSIGGSLVVLEEYNGLGYARMGHPSPYLWSGTDQYHSGKYTADGHYDPHAVDQQLGCVALIKELMKLDPSITFTPEIQT